jgi:hypothetical protein
MAQQLSQRVHFVKGIDAVADFNDTTQYTQSVNCRGSSKVVFIVHKGVGTTGTATITVLAGDTATAAGTSPMTNSTAVAFHYKAITSTDVEGAYTAATSAGFTTTAGSSQIYIIEVDVEAFGQLNSGAGYNYCQLKFAEVVNSPVLGGVIIMLHGNRFQQDIPDTVVT